MTTSRGPAATYTLTATAAAWLLLDLGGTAGILAGLATAGVAVAALALTATELAPRGRGATLGGLIALNLLAGLAAWVVVADSTVGLLTLAASLLVTIALAGWPGYALDDRLGAAAAAQAHALDVDDEAQRVIGRDYAARHHLGEWHDPDLGGR